MAFGLTVQVTHTGLNNSSLVLSDIRETTDGLTGYRKAGPIYVPVGGMVELVYSGDVARSFEAGVIRGFVTAGYVTAILVVPGGGGVSVQDVVASGDTWDGVATTVALDASAIGALGTFLLPDVSTITDGVVVEVKNVDGAFAVALTPNGLDTIDEVAGPYALGGGPTFLKSSIRLTARPATTNWLVG